MICIINVALFVIIAFVFCGARRLCPVYPLSRRYNGSPCGGGVWVGRWQRLFVPFFVLRCGRRPHSAVPIGFVGRISEAAQLVVNLYCLFLSFFFFRFLCLSRFFSAPAERANVAASVSPPLSFLFTSLFNGER